MNVLMDGKHQQVYLQTSLQLNVDTQATVGCNKIKITFLNVVHGHDT